MKIYTGKQIGKYGGIIPTPGILLHRKMVPLCKEEIRRFHITDLSCGICRTVRSKDCKRDECDFVILVPFSSLMCLVNMAGSGQKSNADLREPSRVQFPDLIRSRSPLHKNFSLLFPMRMSLFYSV